MLVYVYRYTVFANRFNCTLTIGVTYVRGT